MSEHLPPMNATARPRRRFLRFSLRAMLLLVVVIGVGLAWLGQALVKGKHQRSVVKALQQADCSVDYEDLALKERVTILEKLRDRLGCEQPLHVRQIWSHSSQVTDAQLVHLEWMSELTSLGLRGSQITDAGLANLRGLTNIETLHLDDTHVTDKGLVDLQRLTKLEDLRLSGTQVTDAGLKNLSGLRSLRVLYVDRTKVTGLGVRRCRDAMPDCIIFH